MPMSMPMPNTQGKVLGILKPVGGGDPIPLMKPELIVGRRRSCDIHLDFNNISGRHCQLRFINNVWHVRDLGSTNGTSLNGMALTSEHTVMPDDELGLASHLYTIDYEPGGPESVVHAIEDMADEAAGRRHSLLELAGIDTDDLKPRHRRSTAPPPAAGPGPRPAPAPASRRAGEESDFNQDIPSDFQARTAPSANTDDDDFLKFIEEDVKRASNKREKR